MLSAFLWMVGHKPLMYPLCQKKLVHHMKSFWAMLRRSPNYEMLIHVVDLH